MKYLVTVLVGICIFSNIYSQSFSKQDSIEIDNLFYYYIGQIPGASVDVIHEDNLVFNKNYGLANIETKDKISNDHLFYFSSLGKIFTSIAILKLVDDNKIKLENNLCEIFPDFPEYGRDIKVENLLTHTSGLPKFNKSEITTNNELFKYLTSVDSLLFKPGSRWSYSNSDYPMLSLIIEKASGMSYQKYLEKKIFKKYKMTKDPFINNSDNQKIVYGHKAHSVYSFELMKPDQDEITGENKIYLNLNDFIVLNKLLFNEKSIANIDLLFKKIHIKNGADMNYGFGWYIVEKRKSKENNENDIVEPIYWMAGKDNGFSNIIAYFPENKLTILIVTNRDYNLNMFEKILKIEELWLN